MSLKYFGNGEKHDIAAGRKLQLTVVMTLVLAATPVTAGPLDVDLDVGLGGGGLDVDLDVGLGGADADVDISLGGGGTGGGVAGPGVPGGPGVTPGTTAVAQGAMGSAGGWACARDANETAYNGFVVRDRAGEAIGWVHGATVSPEGKLLAVRLQSASKACYKLSGGGVRVSGGEVWANVNSSTFR